MGATAPFWRFSAASYPDLEKSTSDDDIAVKANGTLNSDAGTASRVYTLFFFYRADFICAVYISAGIVFNSDIYGIIFSKAERGSPIIYWVPHSQYIPDNV